MFSLVRLLYGLMMLLLIFLIRGLLNERRMAKAYKNRWTFQKVPQPVEVGPEPLRRAQRPGAVKASIQIHDSTMAAELDSQTVEAQRAFARHRGQRRS